jgi:cobalt-zinc-cadmium efflux system protein
MSGDHAHASAVSAAGRHQRPLAIALVLTAAYMVVEAIAGVAFSSLALLSDAAHMLTDVGGLGMALAAIQFGKSRRSRSHTYGLYRLEVLAALVNAVLLFAVAAFVLVEAYRRVAEPPDVPGTPLLVVAAIGMLVNLVSFRLLRAGAGESLNVKGAYLEVMSDMLGSAGVILAGAILLTTGWSYADPIIGAAIGIFILPRTWRLGREALRILLEVAPSDVDIVALEAELAARPGVAAVHDLHVWTLTSGLRAASGHVVLADGADLGAVLADATEVLEHRYSIQHVTLQCEPPRYRESPQEV